MDFKLPVEVKQFMEKSAKANFEIYIVGGAVRDLLMGKIIYDWDFTTNATPEEILKIYPDSKFFRIGINFLIARKEKIVISTLIPRFDKFD